MNISNIVGALFPILFVLALGYLAGKRHTFDADQAAGFSKLDLSFALPASLFVSMTGIPWDLLLGQGPARSGIDSFAYRSLRHRLDRT
jgi:malonate transporter